MNPRKRKPAAAPEATAAVIAAAPVERRAPDQDGAVEVALAEGTLPEADRRAPEPAPVAPQQQAKPVADAPSIEERLKAASARGVTWEIVSDGPGIRVTTRGVSNLRHGYGLTLDQAMQDAGI